MSAKAECSYCYGFGYTQVYATRVMRVYCDCRAGIAAIERSKESLREVGLNPESSSYSWLQRKDILKNIDNGA